MGLQLSVVIWTVVNFLLLMLLLNKLLFKPVLTFMYERQRRIEEGVLQGENAKKAQKEQRKGLQEALSERLKREQQKTEDYAASCREDMKKAVNAHEAESDRKREEVRERLRREREQFEGYLHIDMPELTSALAERLLHKHAFMHVSAGTEEETVKKQYPESPAE